MKPDREDFRGAESKLYIRSWFDLPAVYKKRIAKTYRIKELDNYFRRQRTVHEARLLAKAKVAGVRVPVIYEIDLKETTLVLEYLSGEILKVALTKMPKKKRTIVSRELGKAIGKLHRKGIVHGDLTTSNIIKMDNEEEQQLAFVDFGLGFFTDKEEDFGIDLYLLQKALENTHATFFKEMWPAIIEGYKETSPFGQFIEKKMKEIASRGRYSERI